MDQNNQESKNLQKEKLPSEMSIEELLAQAAHQSQPPSEEDNEKPASFHEEFQWNVHEFPKPKRIDDVEFNWRTGEESVVGRSASTLLQRSHDLQSDTAIAELDKHLSIDPEKEKFQEYLNQEYDRIRAQRKSQSLPFFVEPPVPIEEPVTTESVPVVEVPLAVEVSAAPEAAVDPETIVEPETTAERVAPKEEKSSVEQAFATFLESAAQVDAPIKKKRAFLPNFLLILLLLIVLSEASFLVILNAFPDSQAANVVRTQQKAMMTNATQTWDQLAWWVKDLIGQPEQTPGKEPGKEADPDQQTVPEPAPAPAPTENSGQQEPAAVETIPADPVPLADKSALISSQLGRNKNIKEILANDTLNYQSGKNYGLADLNRSTPISNNIWTGTTNKDAVYYDAALVGALIRFDSEWIDYVNGVDKEVLDLMKPDGKAYGNAIGFTKVGKVKETFLKLEIGEIRQGANGFYVWTKETIQIEEGGKSSTKVYRWIYYLEPIDWHIKVVDYFRF